jgi:uncharacterized protein
LLRDIPDGHTTIERTVPAESLDLGDWTRPACRVEVRLEADRRDHQVTLRGDAWLKVQGSCGRCMEESDFELEAGLLIFADRRGSDEPADEDALEQAGSVLYHDGLELDLGPSLREALILEIPQVVLCKPDCRGLCPECGKNLNEAVCSCTPAHDDPRWEALKTLKDEKPEAKT